MELKGVKGVFKATHAKIIAPFRGKKKNLLSLKELP
jgi:hypothetical protein